MTTCQNAEGDGLHPLGGTPRSWTVADGPKRLYN